MVENLCQKLCRCEGTHNFEKRFPHHNWVLILSLQFIMSTTLAVMVPSLYQFVTTPRHLPDEYELEKNNSRFWPGLDGTDTDYAWILASSCVFEFSAMPFALFLTHRCPFRVTLLVGPLIAAVGGILYALAVNVRMVFLGRGLCGLSGGLSIPALHTYIGEMGTLMDDIRKKQGKKPRKFTLYIAHSLIMNIGFIFAFGLTSLMAQFGDVNQYRWPGWFIVAQSMAQALAVLLIFTETRHISWSKIIHFKSSWWTGLKLSSQLKSKLNLQAYIFLICCSFVIGQFFMIFYTLVTPILSDKFGFSVEYSSYFLLAISGAFLISTFVQLGTKVASIDNRLLLGSCLVFAVVGSVLVGDWQSIGHDPCSSNALNTAKSEDIFQNEFGLDGSGVLTDDEHSNSTYDISQLVERCVARNGSSDQCFWNPQSRITGEFCNTCLNTCLSIQKSLNIYQFSIGIFLLAISTSFAFVLISHIASDVASVHSQGVILTLVLGSGTLSRGISPYWFVKSYDLTGKHTYCVMAINGACTLVLFLSLIALYKNLAPKTKSLQTIATSNPTLFEDKKSDGDAITVKALPTSCLEVE